MAKSTATSPKKTEEREIDLFHNDHHMDALVGVYLNEIGATNLLTPEEEYALAQDYVVGRMAENYLKSGIKDKPAKLKSYVNARLKELLSDDQLKNPRLVKKAVPDILNGLVEKGQAARERLIVANTRLVIRIAKFYKNTSSAEHAGMDFKDFIQEGNMGLMKAIERYDPDTGNRLSTYATWWIRQGITRALADKSRIIRIPVHTSDMMSKVIKATEKLSRDGNKVGIEDIAKETGFNPRRVREIIEAMLQSPDSLDRQIGDEDDSATLSEIVPGEARVEDEYQQKELSAIVVDMMGKLSPQMATVLRLRYGFGGELPHTLEETGERMGLNREKVRRLEAQALGLLRSRKNRTQLRDFLTI